MSQKAFKTFLCMHRTGKIHPSRSTDNQCKAVGHDTFHYHLRMVFSHTQISAERRSFIVDHVHVDRLLQTLAHNGSCEQVQINLRNHIIRFFREHDIELLALRCTLNPVLPLPKEGAWMDVIACTEDKFMMMLAS